MWLVIIIMFCGAFAGCFAGYMIIKKCMDRQLGKMYDAGREEGTIIVCPSVEDFEDRDIITTKNGKKFLVQLIKEM